MKFAHLQKLQIATALIQRKMRVSIIHSITGVNPKTLRSLHREIHGTRPASGQVPTTGRILSTRPKHGMASAFAAIYRSIGTAEICTTLDISSLLKAYDLHLELSSGLISNNLNIRPINITQAWVIARDISIGVAYFRHCQYCCIHYLLADDAHIPPACPICTLRKQEPKLSI